MSIYAHFFLCLKHSKGRVFIMSENLQTPYKKGKKKRETLRLPQLHFIAADDWMNKLGNEEFCTWLKFHTWVDRKDANREYDKIPMSLEASWEKLGISKSKFYRIIKPLWEFGLIDIVEYEESKRTGQKPKNIIVYEYPFHDEDRLFKPLEKLRDWTKDFNSKSKEAGKIGGRPRKMENRLKEAEQQDQEDKKQEKPDINHRFKIKTVYRFKNKTVTVSKLKPNNVLNYSINYQITPSNVSNKNLSILKKVKALNIPSRTVSLLEEQIDRLMLHKIKLIEIELAFNQFKDQMGHEDFNSVLYDVLQAKKFNSSFKKYLEKSLNTFLTNRLNKEAAAGQPKQPIRKEMIPAHMEDQQEQVKDQEQIEKERQELEEMLKAMGENRKTDQQPDHKPKKSVKDILAALKASEENSKTSTL